jgi:hypothetical protein
MYSQWFISQHGKDQNQGKIYWFFNTIAIFLLKYVFEWCWNILVMYIYNIFHKNPSIGMTHYNSPRVWEGLYCSCLFDLVFPPSIGIIYPIPHGIFREFRKYQIPEKMILLQNLQNVSAFSTHTFEHLSWGLAPITKASHTISTSIPLFIFCSGKFAFREIRFVALSRG